MSVVVRPARPGEAGAVVDFLHAHMKSGWPRQRWARLVDRRWIDRAQGPEDFARVAVDTAGDGAVDGAGDGGRIVGVIGVVTADRSFGGRRLRTRSMSSQYLLKDYRGTGLGKALMASASAGEGPVTALSASPNSLKLLVPTGFEVLDRERRLWRLGQGASRGAGRDIGVRLDADAAALATPEENRIIADHAGLAVRPLVLETAAGRCFCMVAPMAKAGALYWYALHLSAPDIFAAAAPDLAERLAALAPGPSLLACDSRMLPGDPGGEAEALPVPHYWKPGPLRPAEMDHLYSETTLLGLKLA